MGCSGCWVLGCFGGRWGVSGALGCVLGGGGGGGGVGEGRGGGTLERSPTANVSIGRIADSPVADSALVTFHILNVELASPVMARSWAP